MHKLALAALAGLLVLAACGGPSEPQLPEGWKSWPVVEHSSVLGESHGITYAVYTNPGPGDIVRVGVLVFASEADSVDIDYVDRIETFVARPFSDGWYHAVLNPDSVDAAYQTTTALLDLPAGSSAGDLLMRKFDLNLTSLPASPILF